MKTIDKIGVKVGHDSNKDVMLKLIKYYKKSIVSHVVKWTFDGVSDDVMLYQVNSKQTRFFTYSKEFGFFDTDVTGKVHKKEHWK